MFNYLSFSVKKKCILYSINIDKLKMQLKKTMLCKKYKADVLNV